ncbi:MAG: protein phosphatase 2C domain-containing protein [Hyphomonadaceae bacterium]|nr:protein phosphatase 2C domain-containing protein [Hyphomonadaceae bacterium]
MLTFVEAISLAGDRAKQNDDTLGFQHKSAWVIDGATDLSETPVTKTASDASWIAQVANTSLNAWTYGDLREAVRSASETAASTFSYLTRGQTIERWQLPTASLLMITENERGVIDGVDLGDCRVFALDADGVQVVGGHDGLDDEVKLAASQPDADKPLLKRKAAIETLRRNRAAINQEGGRFWTFGLHPACADHARAWTLSLKRPAHILLMTDGFAALTDRYRAYEPAALVKAAIAVGLQELGRELRAIEVADAAGSQHPRFKQSDDATAILLRLT